MFTHTHAHTHTHTHAHTHTHTHTHTCTHNIIAGYSVKNCDAFLVLQDAYLSNQSSHLGKVVVDAILNTFRSDPANYFILESHHSLSMFVETLPTENDDVQVCGDA